MDQNKSTENKIRFVLSTADNQFGNDNVYTDEIEGKWPCAGEEVCLSQEQQTQLIERIQEIPEEAQRNASYGSQYWRNNQFTADLTVMRVARVRHFPSLRYTYVELSLVNQGSKTGTKQPAILQEQGNSGNVRQQNEQRATAGR